MTPGNGNAQSARRRAAEAPLESRVLTHLIEGFVIQEGAQPFPVERPSFSVDSLRRHSGDGDMDDLSTTVLKGLQEPRLTCELCGKVDFASIFKRPRRFCSACTKRYSLGCTRRVALFPERRSSLEKGRSRRILSGSLRAVLLEYRKASAAPLCTSASRPAAPRLFSHRDPREPGVAAPQTPVAEGAELPASPCGPLPSEPGRWNVEDVYEFISSLPGCLEIAEEFRSQEIDGQALLLLKEDHLMATMNIKVGPALKILAQISSLQDS